ncbi:NAD-dependent epimerase/dehydratase family protein [Streptomyces sp. NPDC058294]|uniref:NAD-dependent epimerase/dehydratase family protein n=1 Tax=Streptomyces sp. NPDC058294 TaxID=3346430 RepID=UPI0036EA29D2
MWGACRHSRRTCSLRTSSSASRTSHAAALRNHAVQLLITGAAGFVGCALTETPRRAGHAVTAVDDLSVTSAAPPPGRLPGPRRPRPDPGRLGRSLHARRDSPA